MQFNHEEANAFLFEGECRFHVLEAQERQNPFDGSEEINMKLEVTNKENKTAKFFASLNSKKAWHIKNFCLATGIPMEVFTSNSLTTGQVTNKQGVCIMKIYKNKNGEDQSGVNSWVVKKDDTATNGSALATQGDDGKFDDDIPF